MPNLLDIIVQRATQVSRLPNTPANMGSTPSASDSENTVTRQDENGRTVEMWMPGDPFTDDYYFGGYPVPNGGVLIPLD